VPFAAEGVTVRVPGFMDEIIATITHLARASGNINQRSGVSVRLSVSNYETLVANAARRALGHGEDEVVPRVSDLDALVSSTAGKVEIETLEEGRDAQIIDQLLRGAVLTVFKQKVSGEVFRGIVDAFDGGLVVDAGEDVPSSGFVRTVSQVDALRAPVQALTEGDESPAMVASAVEFLLEGLHLSKRLNKDAAGVRASYRSRSA
jgi:magnesium chelatase subunit I